ncbi:MAG TPA: FecR family protein, partial [Nannocystaceae bacterium]|nr:FecR family protein [Nannocystaceae bacterium]
MSDRLEALGRHVAEAQDALREDHRADVRARLLAHAEPSRTSWIRAGAIAAAFAAVVLFMVWPQARPLTFEVGQTRGTVGAWMSAPAERGELLRFSDGSEIELQPRAQARVAELDRGVVRVVLERGAADVRIEKGGERAWHIDAGPYLVVVTGTQFRVSWDPQRESFELDLREGSVIIEGPQLERAQELGAGQSVRIAAPVVAHVEAIAPREVVQHEEVPVQHGDDEPGSHEPPAPRTARTRERTKPVEVVAPTPAPAAPSWRALADEGRYRDA